MPPSQESVDALVHRLASRGPVKSLPTSRRVRVLHKGKYIADSTSALFVWEEPYYPYYYLPKDDVHGAQLSEEDAIKDESGLQLAARYKLADDDSHSSPVEILLVLTGQLSGYCRIAFDSVDAWFEEDTQIFVNPKDPFKRIDLLQSMRRVKVTIGGALIADAAFAVHLHETGLPPRYYIPLTAVKQQYLSASSTKTRCPYKGEAEYWSVEVDGRKWEDVAWYYHQPSIECAAIADMVCFYAEKDGVKVHVEPIASV